MPRLRAETTRRFAQSCGKRRGQVGKLGLLQLTTRPACRTDRWFCRPASGRRARRRWRRWRLEALWLFTRSPRAANSTVWSPTTSPPRTVAKPMVVGARSPVMPSRPLHGTAGFSGRGPGVGDDSPMRSAVPEGGVHQRWWASMISTSKPSASTREGDFQQFEGEADAH